MKLKRQQLLPAPQEWGRFELRKISECRQETKINPVCTVYHKLSAFYDHDLYLPLKTYDIAISEHLLF